MPGKPSKSAVVPCHNTQGRLLAEVEIIAPRNAERFEGALHPLVVLTRTQAGEYGEEEVQLRERGRYEYRLVSRTGDASEYSLLFGRAVQPSQMAYHGEERGLIEPGDYCGRLPLVIIRRGDKQERPIAHGAVEVRSLKMNYREHYRGMLSFIAEKSAGLLLDCRSATRLRLDSLWRDDATILEQQMEFLRHTLESASFQGAINQILRNPHRRLENERNESPITRSIKVDRSFARQIGGASRRTALPESHPLFAHLTSLPERINVQSRIDFMDTAENRFVKMVLLEFRDFLSDIAAHLSALSTNLDTADNARLFRETVRLRSILEAHLARGFFPDILPPTFTPLGSPVLQRKAGYREILHFWLQFHASAQLAWDGGADVYHAGARNVATLYEYWLFFHLESLFRNKFSCKEPLHTLLVDRNSIPPQLVLRRGLELKTPVSGVCSDRLGRTLSAEFHFNRKFVSGAESHLSGSWTRGMRPDYTISIWPAAYSREEAEAQELMVHIHFDAKYRVEHITEMFTVIDDEEDLSSVSIQQEEISRRGAKYADLLKMHAYRDAIRRSAGAYVLYPGTPGEERLFQGYHEILPGLGAFAVCPDEQGSAKGLDTLSHFLDDVIKHLSDRATARERVSYHVSEAYRLEEVSGTSGGRILWESDVYSPSHRALPPAEEMVLAAWYNTESQVLLASSENGFVYVRLGRRSGALHVHPNMAKMRHVVLRTSDSHVAPGLFTLREPGFQVYTRSQLRRELQQHTGKKGIEAWEETLGKEEEEFIYALFHTCLSETFQQQKWDGTVLMNEIERFESDSRNRPVTNLGRTSPYPRILPLSCLLRAAAD